MENSCLMLLISNLYFCIDFATAHLQHCFGVITLKHHTPYQERYACVGKRPEAMDYIVGLAKELLARNISMVGASHQKRSSQLDVNLATYQKILGRSIAVDISKKAISVRMRLEIV
ncbi:hypothetical protein T4A_2230 [Trichinella pseudospiralis]|uniref:Uncharacterized protein n=1 Tax=Trichinella pseudospiralis TaxID=6337 RepID=A0A0V1DT83_TRIPS|nr:hypothetical protein T4A_14323 [Trichinella pseudospiralis]KRY65753.1 hypothetical protein T4A_2230 [Trichinella pseudospiralis]KRY92946.1 hypothetical protein T4D_971 [Trichinella pseudospiralis]KRY92999.1 hypothetical protein T4D_344 [Trichinella pseudospiralis]